LAASDSFKVEDTGADCAQTAGERERAKHNAIHAGRERSNRV
jgi:hypothetical protein